jgi:hypothetical protein
VSNFCESPAQLFGREPRRPAPEEIVPRVQEIDIVKRANNITFLNLSWYQSNLSGFIEPE